MAGARKSVLGFLAAVYLAVSASAGAEERFALTARIESLRTFTNSPVLIIELKNISPEVQRIWMLKDIFEGTVYLRDAWGEIYPFILRHYWNMLVTGTWVTPEVELVSGASHVFQHPLSEFIDWRRTENPRIAGKYDSYAVLSEEFGRGCEIWCELNVTETKHVGQSSRPRQVSTKLRSAPIIDIWPPLLYDRTAKTFRTNPFVVDYAPLLTKDEQDQGKTGDELHAEYLERQANERAKYPYPLRSLMEAHDTPESSDLIAYRHALNEIRRNPSPELFCQFAESVDESTCTVRVMLEHVLFDRYLKLDPWDQTNWTTAMRALVDAVPHVRTSHGLQGMLIFIVQAQGIGRLQFAVPGTEARIDIRATRTESSSSWASPGVYNVSEEVLPKVSQECRRILRERYPELR